MFTKVEFKTEDDATLKVRGTPTGISITYTAPRGTYAESVWIPANDVETFALALNSVIDQVEDQPGEDMEHLPSYSEIMGAFGH